jgi:Ca-activated chloride channel family protein
LKTSYLYIALLLLLLCGNYAHAQEVRRYKPEINRVLFVLDGSGSMKETWNGRTRFDIAKQLLFKLIDSVERKNPNVEFGVRVFGYQYSREQRNCKDSKLLVPFAKNNAANVLAALNKIKPQGMTPITYSLMQGAGDFPKDDKALNSLILITDGNENCEGDMCKASKELIAKRVSLKPFIIGLAVEDKYLVNFKCAGDYYDAKDSASLENTIGVIIKQTLNTTTVQVNLLDNNGNPAVTNIPFTLYDHYSGKILYNFIHTMNAAGVPDTLYLDPVGIYDIEIHTFPSIIKKEIELIPGRHNIIAVDVPTADFTALCPGASLTTTDAQVLVRNPADKNRILNIQDLNEEETYQRGNYKLEILTTPEMVIDTVLYPSVKNTVNVPYYGILSINCMEAMQITVCLDNNGTLQLTEAFEIAKSDSRKLQPGEYWVIYKPRKSYDSETTKMQKVKIADGRTEVLNLE